jgi:hypothetical protein
MSTNPAKSKPFVNPVADTQEGSAGEYRAGKPANRDMGKSRSGAGYANGGMIGGKEATAGAFKAGAPANRKGAKPGAPF